MSDPQRLELSGIDLSGRAVGCLGAEPDPGWLSFKTVTFEQRNRVDHDQMLGMGLNVVAKLEHAEAMVVCLGRSRLQNLGRIARAVRLIPQGAPVIVTGQKTAGVDSLMRQVRKVLPVSDALSKAHGKLFELHMAGVDAIAATADWHEASKPACRDGWVTAPGMFSADGPDPGSQALAAIFDTRITGKIADLGAGWGWLSAQALKAAPGIERIDLYEADADALEAARQNVTDDRATYHWTDVTRLAGTGDMDWVISNPPFHHGRSAEPALGQAFIAAAARLLKPSGHALFVANRQLPYEAQLTESFRHWREIAADGAFKLFEAEKPVLKRR